MPYNPPGYLRVDLPRPPIARDRLSVASPTKATVAKLFEIQLFDADFKLQGSITGESPSYEAITYDAISTGGHRFTINDIRKLDIGPTEILAGDDFRPDVDDTYFLGGSSLSWAGFFTYAIQFADRVADPNANGEFQLNGTDMKVFSGGAVRNLSDIASGGGAPVSSPFVTIGNDGTLSAERALTGTTDQITVTDNGANSTVVLSTPQDINTSSIPAFAGMGLSGDLNMIINDILNVLSVQETGTEATTGFVRMANASTIEWRDAANVSDIGFGLDSNDNFIIDSSLIPIGSATEDLGSIGSSWQDVHTVTVKLTNGGVEKGNLIGNVNDITLSAIAGNDILIGDDVTILFVDGGGGNIGIGAAATSARMVSIRGSISGNDASSLILSTTVTQTTTRTDAQGIDVGLSNTIQTGVTITNFAQVTIREPNFTLEGTGAVTNAAALRVIGASTEATNNYAFWIDDGLSRFDGDIIPGTDKGSSIGTATLRWLDLNIENINWYQNSGAIIGDIDEGNGDWFRISARGAGMEFTSVNTEYRFGANGVALLFIGLETANADMAESGITIKNDGATIHQYLAFKHDQVAHGMTTLIETDTFFDVKNGNATAGGVHLHSWSEGNFGFDFSSDITTGSTTRSTAAFGPFQFFAGLKTGTTAGVNGADDNLFVVNDFSLARLLIAADGDIHSDTGVISDSWDDQPDWLVARSIRDNLRVGYEDNFREMIAQRGIMTYNDDGHHFMSHTKMFMFQLDAIYQTGEKVFVDHEQRIAELEVEICLLKNS